MKAFYQKYKFFILLTATCITSVLAGMEWVGYKVQELGFYNAENFELGATYAFCLLFILTVHEFGHYFVAKHYKADVTLPSYIPMWFFGFAFSIGTMGAYISIRSPLHTRSQFFDVGVAGPLAGFAAALVVLLYGFTHIPPIDYLFTIHPEYAELYSQYGMDFFNHIPKNENAIIFSIGDNLIFQFFKYLFIAEGEYFPPAMEMMHYPILFAGYLATFFTALNLIPIGQLDGGHVLYGLFGYKRFNQISPIIYLAFIFFAGLGIINPGLTIDDYMGWPIIYVFALFYMLQNTYPEIKQRLTVIIGLVTLQFLSSYLFPNVVGYTGYMMFAFVIGRFLGVKHPPSLIEQEMSTGRKAVAILAIVVFILCFSPYPFSEG